VNKFNDERKLDEKLRKRNNKLYYQNISEGIYILMQNRSLYAVLIDADNIPSIHAQPILKEIATFGEPALRRVYGDWSNEQLRGWVKTVRENGLVAHQESSNTKGKNASDIGLVIDAMDILHSGRFNGFVLVSSDSDFTALANRIREQGLEVIGIGERKTPESLRNVCNRFIFIENIVDEASSAQTTNKISGNKQPVKDAIPLIIAAMEEIEHNDEWYPLSVLGSRIMAAKPDFDPRTYGCKKLSELISKLNQNFKTRKDKQHLYVKLTTQVK